jgi:type I restriction enzyme, S subunit
MSLNLDKSTWKRVALGEVAAASKEKVDPTDGSVDRYVAGEHMDTDDLGIHRWGDVGETDLGPAFHRRFRAGQVLYGSRRTYLRKVAVADFDGVCANTTFVVETKEDVVLLQGFLPFVMTAEPFHAFAIAESKGSVNPYVNWSDIERYEFDLPSLNEQQRIAELLWAVEACGRSKHEARAAATAAKSAWLDRGISAMLERASVPFSEVWSRSPESGWSVAPIDEATGRYVLSLAALGPEGYRSGNLKNIPDTIQARAATLHAGDLLISRANTAATVGRAGIYSEDRSDISFPDTMMRVSLRNDVLATFAVAVLGSEHGRAHMRRSAAGSATSMVKINRSSLGRLRFPVASPDKQASLLADLGRFEAAVAALDTETEGLAVLRSSLLADIFGASDGSV